MTQPSLLHGRLAPRARRTTPRALIAGLAGLLLLAPFSGPLADDRIHLFPTLTEAEPAGAVISEPIVVSGFRGLARTFGATRAEVSVNGGPFVAEAEVHPGDTVRLRARAPEQANASDTAHLTLGHREANWMIVTKTLCTAPPEAFQQPGRHDLLVPYGCTEAAITATAGGSDAAVSADVAVEPGEQATIVVGDPAEAPDSSVSVRGAPVIVAPGPGATPRHLPPGWARNGNGEDRNFPEKGMKNGKGGKKTEGVPADKNGAFLSPASGRPGSVSIRWK